MFFLRITITGEVLQTVKAKPKEDIEYEALCPKGHLIAAMVEIAQREWILLRVRKLGKINIV